MPASLRLGHLSRYQQLARLLVKYGRSDLLRRSELAAVYPDGDLEEEQAEAAALAADLERLGPTFIKLGQLLSTRTDLLPVAYTEALSRLQDDVTPVPYAEVEEQLTGELGVRLARAFDTFDPKPVAAASLGQVHRAVLRGGRRVVVKVQRPGIRRQVLADMEVLEEIAGFLDAHTETGQRYAVANLLEQFRRSLMAELDYRQEAAHLRQLAAIVADRPLLVVPEPFEDYTTSRVLTMRDVGGRKVTDVSPVALLDIDTGALADELFGAYLDMILVHGFFHADPHPGNVLLTSDGRLALVDVGMVARVSTGLRGQLLRLLLALADGNGDEVARITVDMSEALPDFDEATFMRTVAELAERASGETLERLNVGSVVMDLTRRCAANGLQPPPELSMVGKALLNLDEVARTLAPGFRPLDVVRRHVSSILRSSVQSTPGSLVAAALEAKDFAEQLPGRVNRAMDALASGRFELKVQAFDETDFLRGLHRMANRVAVGVVLGALIIGAALLSQVHGSAKVFGYPAVAFVFFVLAAVGGFALVASIVISDRRMRRRRWRR